MNWQLTDARVLVTGASTGIGAAIARAFADAGAHVAVHCNRSKDAAEEVAQHARDAGVNAAVLQGDMTDPAVPGRLVEETVDAFGGLDVLINNAGGLVARQPADEISDDLLEEVTNLNYYATVRSCRAAIGHLTGSAHATIVNMTSIAARNGGGPGSSHYAASKAAVSGYTRAIAKELAGSGIRVNALAPGVIDTPFHERHTAPDAMEKMRGTIPMGRVGLPEECAGAALYLSSPASSYVTGQILEINGGQYFP